MANRWINRLVPRRPRKNSSSVLSYLRQLVTGSLYRLSDARTDSSIAEIKTQIDTMRALARDSQIGTALSYYATDATTVNSNGDIIWATAVDDKSKDAAEVVNALLVRWDVARYARDHILELATIGNLYIPTTLLFSEPTNTYSRKGIVLDNNTIKDVTYDIIPSYKIPPENMIHLWYQGEPQGYVMQPDDAAISTALILPEMACIHFSLGGLLGDYTISGTTADGDEITYDVQFAQPLMERAVQPTQTLSLLEDAVVLSSLARTIKFLNVECGTADDVEIRNSLQQVKDAVEQQLALNTASGDVQSFVNPQSPNNLIYLPKINGQDPLSITDLNMAEASDADNKLLQYYQDKKLSVLGVPKEAMNFSSNEGLGGAGSVLSQRSALYANSLQRLETAYINGWTDAINKYFKARNMSGFINKFKLHMNPIITPLSTVTGEKRDSALTQATNATTLLKDLGVTDPQSYHNVLVEILSEMFPVAGTDARTWDINIPEGSEGGESNAF